MVPSGVDVTLVTCCAFLRISMVAFGLAPNTSSFVGAARAVSCAKAVAVAIPARAQRCHRRPRRTTGCMGKTPRAPRAWRNAAATHWGSPEDETAIYGAVRTRGDSCTIRGKGPNEARRGE